MKNAPTHIKPSTEQNGSYSIKDGFLYATIAGRQSEGYTTILFSMEVTLTTQLGSLMLKE